MQVRLDMIIYADLKFKTKFSSGFVEGGRQFSPGGCLRLWALSLKGYADDCAADGFAHRSAVWLDRVPPISGAPTDPDVGAARPIRNGAEKPEE